MSLTRVDFPAPDTPVIAAITPSGSSTSRFWRLFSAAPITDLNDEPFVGRVTDLGLPGMSGREMARAIAAIDPEVPILLITGWGVQLDPDELVAGRWSKFEAMGSWTELPAEG